MPPNVAAQGLGLPLPAGKVAVFAKRNGHRILVGEGKIDDHTIGEKVEVSLATATGVWAHEVPLSSAEGRGHRLTLTNDLPTPQQVEIELQPYSESSDAKLVKRDGWMVWQVTVPANGRSEMTYRSRYY